MKRGSLIIISGPSAAGKNQVVKSVLERCENLKLSTSVTTRAKKPNEIDGVDYYFKSLDEYTQMLHNDEFIEHQCVYNNYYGTLRKPVEEMLKKGYDVILEVDVKGALEVMKKYDGTISIFVCHKDLKSLYGVIKNKYKGISDKDLQKKVDDMIYEIKKATSYGYIVINDENNSCVDDVLAIIRAEKCSIRENKKFIDSIINGGNLI